MRLGSAYSGRPTLLTESSSQHAIHARLMQYGIGIDNPLTIFVPAIPPRVEVHTSPLVVVP